MASYASVVCPKCKDKRLSEILWDDRKQQGMRCDTCALLFNRESPQRVQKSLRYPMFNDSLGVRVESRDHENHVAKKLGMVPTTATTIDGRRPKSTRRKLVKAAKV